MKKHNVDISLMILSKEDEIWGYETVFDTKSLEFKETLNDHYLQYFPPIEKKLFEKIAAINFLKLKSRESLKILDLSTGCGHFMVIANKLGHVCQGTEIPESVEILKPLHNHYQLDIFPLFVEKQVPLNLPKKYDLIISTRTVFDEGWSKEDWIFFRDNLLDFLTPTGEIFLKTNIKAIPNNFTDASIVLGHPIKGWNTLTYHLKK